MEEKILGRIFAVKTTGGQEKSVANFIGNRALSNKKQIYASMALESLKGYVFFEAPNAQVVGDAIAGFKHVKSQVPGIIQFTDIEKFLVVESAEISFSLDDIVEVTHGPFKGLKAKITRVDSKSDVTIVLLDAPYQLPVTVDAAYLKLVEKAKTEDQDLND